MWRRPALPAASKQASRQASKQAGGRRGLSVPPPKIDTFGLATGVTGRDRGIQGFPSCAKNVLLAFAPRRCAFMPLRTTVSRRRQLSKTTGRSPSF